MCGCCGGRCDACGDVRCIRCSVGGKYCGVVYYVVVCTQISHVSTTLGWVVMNWVGLDCIGFGCRLGGDQASNGENE